MTWRNWSGSVECAPRALVAPISEPEVQAAVRDAARRRLTLRVTGAGHSFVPLCSSNGLLLSLDRLQGVIDVDRDRRVATVHAGTRLYQLGPPLRAAGLAMENLGDIDRQAIAGAIATGTHGTGRELGSLSTQVIGVRLVTADGEVRECSAEHDPQLWRAAALGLGALGVVTAITLRLLPAYHLRERVWQLPYAECMAQLSELVASHRHCEFFYDPQSDVCTLKAIAPTAAPAMPPTAAAGTYPNERIGPPEQILPSPRVRKFNECEYAVPAASGSDCMDELRVLLRRRYQEVRWPVEYRTLAADDLPLSPAYRRASVTLSVHEGAHRPHAAFFAAAEAICRAHHGRPHWGKVHSLGAAELAALFPEWSSFLAVRASLDPDGRFLNGYLRHLLLGG